MALRIHPRFLVAAVSFACVAGAPGALAAKGYAVLSVGQCLGTIVPLIALNYRSPGSIVIRNLRDFPDDAVKYSDELGEFHVSINYLEAGEWTIENHAHGVNQYGVTQVVGPNYGYRFTVVAGKAVYLGRFCSASQDEYADTLIGKRRRPKQVYVLVTRNQQRDFEVATTKEPELAGIEVIDAVPANPSSVTPLWHSTPLEPRVLGTK